MKREAREFIISCSGRAECGSIIRALLPEFRQMAERFPETSGTLAFLKGVDDALDCFWDGDVIETLPGFPLVFVNVTFAPEAFDAEWLETLKST